MMQEVEVLKTIRELICSFFSEEQFTLSPTSSGLSNMKEKCYTVYADDLTCIWG